MQKETFNPLELFREKCKREKIKVTPQRLAIYQELLKSKEHPNAEILFKKVRKIYPNISFDTVNRTLLTFSNIGILNVVEGYGEPKRFDPNTHSHHHFRCIKCNRILDFYDSSYDSIKLPESFEKQHIIISKRVVLEGICDKCSNNS